MYRNFINFYNLYFFLLFINNYIYFLLVSLTDVRINPICRRSKGEQVKKYKVSLTSLNIENQDVSAD